MPLSAAAALLSRTNPELWLVTAAAGPRRGGLIAACVSSVSIVPELPRMLLALARQHHTWELVEASGAFALHLLGERNLDWVYRFGMVSGRGQDKLAGLDVRIGPTGSPLVGGSLGWLECRVEARLDIGDRRVYVAEVVDAETAEAEPVLTAQRLLQLVPADRLRELKEQLVQDGAVDTRAIETWRQQQRDRA